MAWRLETTVTIQLPGNLKRAIFAGRSRRGRQSSRIADALQHRRHDVSAGGMMLYLEQAAVRVQISADNFERGRSGLLQRLANSFGITVAATV